MIYFVNNYHFEIASRTTSLQRTPRSLNEHNGLLQTVTSWTTSKFSPSKFSTPSSTAVSSDLMSSGSSSILLPTTSFLSCHDTKKSEKRSGKLLGPHCVKFLSKIGLLKAAQSIEHLIEIDDHQCFKGNETVS